MIVLNSLRERSGPLKLSALTVSALVSNRPSWGCTCCLAVVFFKKANFHRRGHIPSGDTKTHIPLYPHVSTVASAAQQAA